MPLKCARMACGKDQAALRKRWGERNVKLRCAVVGILESAAAVILAIGLRRGPTTVLRRRRVACAAAATFAPAGAATGATRIAGVLIHSSICR